MPSTIRGSDNFDSAGGNACKAWVNFNGTGTVAIRASYNVSSITDNGTMDYTINFATALPDANYAAIITQNQENSSTYSQHRGVATSSNSSYQLKSTTQVRTVAYNTIGSSFDPFEVLCAVFR